jgi:type VI secretion system protein ImpC
MDFSLTFGDSIPQQDVERDPSNPFHILAVGDFGADESWNSPVTVDRDNIDEIFKRLDVKLTLALEPGAPAVEIAFTEFDDFHPDRLFERLELFASLRTRRNRLKNSETFEAESAAILGAGGQTADTATAGDTPQPDPPVVDRGDLLDMAVEQAESRQKSFADQIAEGQLNIDDYARQGLWNHMSLPKPTQDSPSLLPVSTKPSPQP